MGDSEEKTPTVDLVRNEEGEVVVFHESDKDSEEEKEGEKTPARSEGSPGKLLDETSRRLNSVNAFSNAHLLFSKMNDFLPSFLITHSRRVSLSVNSTSSNVQLQLL